MPAATGDALHPLPARERRAPRWARPRSDVLVVRGATLAGWRSESILPFAQVVGRLLVPLLYHVLSPELWGNGKWVGFGWGA